MPTSWNGDDIYSYFPAFITQSSGIPFSVLSSIWFALAANFGGCKLNNPPKRNHQKTLIFIVLLIGQVVFITYRLLSKYTYELHSTVYAVIPSSFQSCHHISRDQQTDETALHRSWGSAGLRLWRHDHCKLFQGGPLQAGTSRVHNGKDMESENGQGSVSFCFVFKNIWHSLLDPDNFMDLGVMYV